MPAALSCSSVSWRGVEDAGARVGDVRDDGRQFQAVHEAGGGGAAALDAEGDHAAGAVGQVLLREGMGGVAGEAGIVDPGDAGVPLQVLRDGEGVAAMARHAQMQGFEAQVEDVGGEGVLLRADVAHELDARLHDVGRAAEPLRVDHAVVGRVGRAELGEFAVVPVEVAAVHDGAAGGLGVAVHVFGGGVGHDVGAPFDGPAEDRRGEGVVHDERHALGVGDPRQLLEVGDRERGVRDGFGEERLGVRTEGGGEPGFVGVLVDEGERDAHLLHGDGEEIEGAAIDGRGADDMVARLAEVEDGEKRGRLAGGGDQRADAAFERGDLVLDAFEGGVAQARVEMAGNFQVEELAEVVGGVVLEGGALEDGQHARLAVLGLPAGLHATRFDVLFRIHGELLWLGKGSTLRPAD